MANPEDGGDFEQFISDRIDFTTAPPRTGDSGDCEQFITDRIDFIEYQASEEGGILLAFGLLGK